MFKMFKKFSKKDWLMVLLSIILIVVQVWLDLKLPDYMSSITSLIQTEGSKMKNILEQGIYMVGCAFGSLISAIFVGYLASNLAASFSKYVL